MAKLISKTYAVHYEDINGTLAFTAVLQFPEHTDPKHWERIAGQLLHVLDQPYKPHEISILMDEAESYVSQHSESGFSIIFIKHGATDYKIGI